MDDEALNRALIMGGLGAMGSGGSGWQKLASGGMFALQGYDDALSSRDRAKILAAKLLEEQQQAQAREQAMRRQQALMGIFTSQAQQPQGPQGQGPQQPQQPNKSIPQLLLEAGFVKEAEEAAKAQSAVSGEDAYGKVDPKDYTPESLLKFAQTRKRSDLVPRDKLVADNLGGTTRYRTEYDPTPRGEAPHTLTPGEVQSGGFDQQRLALEAKRLKMEQERMARERTQYDPERGGLVNLDTGEFRTATQGGQPLAPKLGDKQKSELSDIAAQLAVVQGGIKAAQETPTAFSTPRGLATMAGAIPESLASRNFDTSDEREARSYVFNVVSKVINERAGAAQSKQELARLRAFLPGETDNAQQIVDKFKSFETYLKDLQGARSQPVTGSPATPSAPSPSQGGNTVTYGGKTYRFPSGAAAQAFKMEVGMP